MTAINPRILDEIAASYDCDLLEVAEACRATARHMRASRPIESAEAYVGAVRRLFPEETGFGILDGRIIAPLWRNPAVRPSEWWGGEAALEWATRPLQAFRVEVGPPDRPECGRAWDWVAYWYATQGRPDVVGSSHNGDPNRVARAWALGLPADLVRGMTDDLLWYLPMQPRWRGNRDRVRAVIRLARKGAGLWGALRTADLRRLARLPGWLLRAVGQVPTLCEEDTEVRRVDWREVQRVADLVRPWRERLQALRIPAYRWRVLLEIDDGWVHLGKRFALCAEDGNFVRMYGSASERIARLEQAEGMRAARECAAMMRGAWGELRQTIDTAWLNAQTESDDRWIGWLATEPGLRRAVADSISSRYEYEVVARHAAVRAACARLIDEGGWPEDLVAQAARQVAWDISRVREARERFAPARPVPDLRTRLAQHRYTRRVAERLRRIEAAIGRRDSDGGLVGAKALVYRNGVLRSPQQGTPWERPYLVAPHWGASAVIRGTCGIHAWWCAEQQETGYGCDVMASVRGYGRFAEGPEGWRAEEVVIVGIEIRDHTLATPEIIAQLQARYGVPVTVRKEV